MFSFKERFWASLTHVPIVTLIWIGYIACNQWQTMHTSMVLSNITTCSSLPLMPILLTLLSIPIALGIRTLQKNLVFVRDNAQAALVFNIWLLKWYAISCIIAAIGSISKINVLILAAGMGVFLLSLLCFVQSIIGIITVMNNKVFHYWRPKI
jgi:hypothetical protein